MSTTSTHHHAAETSSARHVAAGRHRRWSLQKRIARLQADLAELGIPTRDGLVTQQSVPTVRVT
ncbi:MAG: hypothetical protein ACLP0J_17075 [Solirubrobacteraceae bacterium]